MRNFDKQFENRGYRGISKLLSDPELETIRERLHPSFKSNAGNRRFLDHAWCRELARDVLERVRKLELVNGDFVSVLCTYFSKNRNTNWTVAPHRDTCVPVQARFPSNDWRNWTTKQNIPHAQATDGLLLAMFAIRLNIDPSTRDNGGLVVVPGSHRSSCADSSAVICEGDAGSALMMNPLLIHSSKKSNVDAPRRVLHFLYGPRELSPPARWYYAV